MVGPAGEDFVHIGLVAGIEDDGVVGGIEDAVNRNGQCNHPQIGA